MSKFIIQSIDLSTLDIKTYNIFNSLPAAKGELYNTAIEVIINKEGNEKANNQFNDEYKKYDGYFLRKSEDNSGFPIYYLCHRIAGWVSWDIKELKKYFISQLLSKETKMVQEHSTKLPNQNKLMQELQNKIKSINFNPEITINSSSDSDIDSDEFFEEPLESDDIPSDVTIEEPSINIEEPSINIRETLALVLDDIDKCGDYTIGDNIDNDLLTIDIPDISNIPEYIEESPEIVMEFTNSQKIESPETIKDVHDNIKLSDNIVDNVINNVNNFNHVIYKELDQFLNDEFMSLLPDLNFLDDKKVVKDFSESDFVPIISNDLPEYSNDKYEIPSEYNSLDNETEQLLMNISNCCNNISENYEDRYNLSTFRHDHDNSSSDELSDSSEEFSESSDDESDNPLGRSNIKRYHRYTKKYYTLRDSF